MSLIVPALLTGLLLLAAAPAAAESSEPPATPASAPATEAAGGPAGDRAGSPAGAADLVAPPAISEGLAALLGEGVELPPARLRFEAHVGQRALVEGRSEEAAEHFQAVVRGAPGHAGAWLLLSRALVTSGRLLEGRDSAVRAVELLEALPPARQAGFGPLAFHEQLGMAEEAIARLDDARVAYERALHHAPHVNRLRLRLGSVLLRLGRDEEALAQFAAAVEAEPESGAGWLGLGRARLRLDDLPGASEALLAAARLLGDVAEVHHALAAAYRAQGDDERQEASLREFERLRTLAEARQRRAEALASGLREAVRLRAAGDPAAAVARLESLLEDPQALAAASERASVLVELARGRRDLGDRAGARRALEAALVERDGDFLAHFELGTLLGEGGQVEAAAAHLVRAVAANPFDYAAHVNLALAHGLLGRLNDALGELRKAATLQPEDVAVRQLLVDLHVAVGQHVHAVALAQLGGVTLPGEAVAATGVGEQWLR